MTTYDLFGRPVEGLAALLARVEAQERAAQQASLAALQAKLAPSMPHPAAAIASVATSLGNTDPAAGSANVLTDPTFEAMSQLLSVYASTDTLLARNWWCSYTVTSGTDPGTIKVSPYFERGAYDRSTKAFIDDNPQSSTRMRVYANYTTVAHTLEAFLWEAAPTEWRTGFPPYLTASVTVPKLFSQNASVTVASVTVQILHGGSVVAESEALDLTAPVAFTRRIGVSYAPTTSTDTFVWRLKLLMGKAASATQTGPVIDLFQPQFAYTFTPDPAIYQPEIAAWTPSRLLAFQTSADYAVTEVSRDGVHLGSGTAAPDVRAYRSTTKTLTIDDTAGGAASLNVVGAIKNGGTQVLVGRKTGWSLPTGVATRTTFATSTVTLSELAERVHALIDDLMDHGLIGS